MTCLASCVSARLTLPAVSAVDREGPQQAVQLLRNSEFYPGDLKSAVAERLQTAAASHGLVLPTPPPPTASAAAAAPASAAAGTGSEQAATTATTSQPDTVRRRAGHLQ